ncbi:MAG TPA: aminodeoxychorismate synthase component I [Xanthomonadaceae bacterium]|nr:aminodeoxychorismate synthase component I [Xanthomonadaceae bacterium]
MRANTTVCRVIDGVHDLAPLAGAWPGRYPALLESAGRGVLGRHDLLLAWNGEAILAAHGETAFAAALDAAQAAVAVAEDPAAPPFVGGWCLFLAYEYAQAIERKLQLPRAPGAFPTALALRCPAAVVVDHLQRRTLLVAEAEHAHWIERMGDDLAAAPVLDVRTPGVDAIDEDPEQRFLDGVERVHQYLRAGDVFQVNLSRGWSLSLRQPVRPIDLHCALRASNPAPFAGLLQWQGEAIVSSSPERLVQTGGGHVQTRPIAGTRPRGADAAADMALMAELIAHPKERAEHIMLIDLERNDLGRVCVPGSVEVSELMAVESYSHVHHIVSNVCGRLRAGVTPSQVIHAIFPGGTITGCPKVRCMEIIAELERAGRGPYTGALGYLGRDGRMDLNILIRTLWTDQGRVRLRAGSGIVADSDPLRELHETRAKARGLLRAFGVA